MYRIACKTPEIESACRKPSCVFPGICPNLNTDHSSLIQLYRSARALPGVKKILIASGLRYDLAVESPEYVKELVEKETGVPQERGQIAGVFVRRMKIGMPLQTDPTVIYGLGEHVLSAFET